METPKKFGLSFGTTISMLAWLKSVLSLMLYIVLLWSYICIVYCWNYKRNATEILIICCCK
jgi:hypothetical protein